MSPGKTITAGPAASRYVIACKSPTYYTKAFQLTFGADGSVMVVLPNVGRTAGRLGIVTFPAGVRFIKTMRVGQDWPVTSHWVKYSHHPSGRAHFSLTGKIRPDVGRQAAPLAKVDGHLFTVMLQGMDKFAPVEVGRKSNAKRQVLPFGLERDDTEAVRFIGYLLSHRAISRQFFPVNDNPPHPWILAYKNGKPCVSILLATPFYVDGEQRFLHLVMERISRINPQSDVHVSLLGGFDEASVVNDSTLPSSYLLCIYPEQRDFAEIAAKQGSVDLE